MRRFGLIGFPLSHSFSRGYFKKKFADEQIVDSVYENYPLPSITDFPDLILSEPELVGLNVTIPYKEAVIEYLDELDEDAAQIGAVNTIKITSQKKLIGYNTDVYGFEQSLLRFISKHHINIPEKGLILGTGGASKAVEFVFNKLGIHFTYVSRSVKSGIICYQDIDSDVISNVQIIVNTTPLGMSPKIDTFPLLPYEAMSSKHLLFDLVYNPEKTVFLNKGAANGANILNGLEMLHGQAEKAWSIWNDTTTE
jgi:shikimate dehydrogenase